MAFVDFKMLCKNSKMFLNNSEQPVPSGELLGFPETRLSQGGTGLNCQIQVGVKSRYTGFNVFCPSPPVS